MLTKEARQILIHFNAWRRGQSDAPEMPDPKESGKAIDVAIEAMGDAWISVEDRLPEINCPIHKDASKSTIVWNGSEVLDNVIYLETAGKFIYGGGTKFGREVKGVIKWQPLPAPPKTEQ